MKTFVALLVLCAVRLAAQGDCGNCWVIGGGCDPLAICDVNGVCQVCEYFVECDNHDCAHWTGWFCQCPTGVAAKASCQPRLGVTGAKHILAKQQVKNSQAVQKVAWYRWHPFWSNGHTT